MLLVSIYVMFLLLHVYDNGSAVLRVDKSIHARLSCCVRETQTPPALGKTTVLHGQTAFSHN